MGNAVITAVAIVIGYTTTGVAIYYVLDGGGLL